ncbi:YqaJ viral recombinase family protein [Frankia sp. Cj3]|uniref:YqaJ viral recombinase family nuclease n=1 Tax=Frankia sp. Cj3 TaxID=2880976 RepID=UPI001EF3FFE2|nr:YqaJ viral recombinase family protein [Frankia sp. Cj3]
MGADTRSSAPRCILPAGADRTEWLAARRRGIGSSDISALLGLSAWASPYSLWVDKTTGLAAEGEPTDGPLYWGKTLEGPIADDFARRNGFAIREPGLVGHPTIPWALATPDREVIDPATGEVIGLVEVKTASTFQGHAWDGDDLGDPDRPSLAPENAIVQLQWQLFVCGLNRGWVAGLVGGQWYHQIEYARDDALVATLVEVAGAFWAQVESGQRPACDGHPATTAALRELYRASEDSSVLVDPTIAIPLLIARHQAKAEEKDAKFRAAEAENQLKELIGHHSAAVSDGSPLYTWRSDVNGRRRFHVPRGVI